MSVTLRDGLVLCAPGGLFVPNESTLVVADVHAGYTATLRSRGYSVPACDDAGLLDRIRSLLLETRATRVVIAGDLVHGAAAVRGALARFLAALEGCEVAVVLGNHDRAIGEWLASHGVNATAEVALGPHRVHHGDDVERASALREEAMAHGGRVIVGHLHPAVLLHGAAGVQALVPAFVTARGLVCLPALSPYARGVNVLDPRMRDDLRALVGDESLGAACVVGEETIAIGVIARGGRG